MYMAGFDGSIWNKLVFSLAKHAKVQGHAWIQLEELECRLSI